MSDKEIILSGKSIDELKKQAAKNLDSGEDDLVYEELDSKGMFRIISSKKRYRFFVKETSENTRSSGTPETILKKILELIDFKAEIKLETEQDCNRLIIDAGENDALLIGKKGRTLDALQHLVARVYNGTAASNMNILVDVSGYREKRRQRLAMRATQVADKVLKTGNEAITAPMSAAERKIIHQTVNKIPQVGSYAIGEGFLKKVVISPMDKSDHISESRVTHQAGD